MPSGTLPDDDQGARVGGVGGDGHGGVGIRCAGGDLGADRERAGGGRGLHGRAAGAWRDLDVEEVVVDEDRRNGALVAGVCLPDPGVDHHVTVDAVDALRGYLAGEVVEAGKRILLGCHGIGCYVSRTRDRRWWR